MPADLPTIAELLRPEAVRVGLPGGPKAEVLDAVLALLAGAPEVADPARVRADVVAREAQMSTGVGQGLALPHARTAAVSGTAAAFAVTDEPVPFDAIDGEPVRLVFLLVGPEGERGRHVRLLGRVSLLMSRAPFRERLLAAASPEEVIAAFREAEGVLA